MDPPEVQLVDGFKKLKVDDVKTTYKCDSSHVPVRSSSLLKSFESNGPVHSHCVQVQPLTLADVVENGEMDPNGVLEGSSNSSVSVQHEVLSYLLPGDSFLPVLPSVLEEDCDWLSRIDHR